MTWKLTYAQRPWSMNDERKAGSWHRRDGRVREWREFFCWEAKRLHVPKMDVVTVVALPEMARGRLQDVANCFPAVKAAIDGLVLAGVLVDDDPKHLIALTFLAPRRNPDALHLYVTPTRTKEL